VGRLLVSARPRVRGVTCPRGTLRQRNSYSPTLLIGRSLSVSVGHKHGRRYLFSVSLVPPKLIRAPILGVAVHSIASAASRRRVRSVPEAQGRKQWGRSVSRQRGFAARRDTGSRAWRSAALATAGRGGGCPSRRLIRAPIPSVGVQSVATRAHAGPVPRAARRRRDAGQTRGSRPQKPAGIPCAGQRTTRQNRAA